MKKGIHPENYRLVAFKDMSNEEVFITRSCVNTKETIVVDGVEYPVVKLEISSSSHPFYTGKTKIIDTAVNALTAYDLASEFGKPIGKSTREMFDQDGHHQQSEHAPKPRLLIQPCQ